MAELTVQSILEISLGAPLKLVILKFASVNRTDQYHSLYQPGILDAWAQDTAVPGSQQNTGCSFTLSGNAHAGWNPVISFNPAVDGDPVTMFLLVPK